MAEYIANLAVTAAQYLGSNAAVTAVVANVAYFGSQALISYGSSALAAPDIPKGGAGASVFNQTQPPRRRLLNRARMGGPRMLREARKNLYQVMATCQAPVLRIDAYWLHDDPVTVDGSDRVVFSGSPANKYKGNGVWILNRLGAATETSYSGEGPWNTETLGDLGAGVWTSAHRGDGVCSHLLVCAAVEQNDFRKVYPYGHPMLSTLPVGAVYDWRKDSTRGGSGAHRLDDWSTWEESWNPILWLALTEAGPVEREDFVERFERKVLAQVASWTQAADDCEDQIYTVATGTYEDRYRIAGWYYDINDVADVRKRILATCDGFLMQGGSGSLHVQVGKWRAPTMTLPRAHIKALRWRRLKRADEAINQLVISYLSPQHKWTVVPGEVWEDADDIALRGLKSADFTADWTPSHSQARRLAKILQKRTMADGQGVVQTTLYGLNIPYSEPAEGEAPNRRWVNLERERADGTVETLPVEIIGSPRVDMRALTVEFDIRRADSTAYDWDPPTEEGAPADPDLTGVDSLFAAAPMRGEMVTTSTFDAILY
ncbi:MAG: hypothetical protein KF842_06735 [Caulobacter sp.]|nr:hypothetical protein [Caulobacter sp.]